MDEEIGFIFTDIAKIDLEHHLPILFDFWEMVLFNTNNYQRNTLQKHVELHQKFPLKKSHFDKWLSLFKTTIDENFSGKMASLAKERADSIAIAIQTKTVMRDFNSKNLI